MSFILIFVLFSSFARSYVENITHGYQNCMACHHSPNGGGLLNDYGRSLSKEAMSTWGWKNSEEPLFGVVKNTKRINYGGDVRTLQTYVKNDRIQRGQLFEMQKNIELGVKLDDIWLIGALGAQGGPEGTPKKDRFLSERHYLLWATSEDSRLRIGKFRQNFGLNDPNHTRFTKYPLGFGSNSETYIMEFSKFYETHEISTSLSLGRIDIPLEKTIEKNASTTYSHYMGGKSKVGTSILLGESQTKRRAVTGIHGLVSMTDSIFTKFEFNYQRSNEAQRPDKGIDLANGFLSLNQKLMKGIIYYIFNEQLQTDLKDSRSRQHAPGLGIQWLPIPHVELQVEVKRQFNRQTPKIHTDIAWLLFHFYL